MSRLELLDRSLSLQLNALHCPASDAFWHFMSTTTYWIPLYVALIVLIFWRLGWKKAIIMLVAISLAIAFSDQMCNLVKNSVARLRPCNDEQMLADGLWSLYGPSERHPYGFWSAHAANSMAIATGCLMALRMDKRKKWLGFAAAIYIWAALVALSRVFMARHFLGDIIVGTVAGCLAGYLFCLAARAVCQKVFKEQE